MKIEEKTILWKPVSEYTGGRVLATNGLDILVGELNPEGDCVSEDCSGIHLCGITHFAKIDGFFPTLRESKDEKIRNQIINFIEEYGNPIHCEWQKDWIAWLEKQGNKKPVIDGTFVNVDEVREDFMQEVYRILDTDSTNDRANQIIDAFDNLPTIEFEKKELKKL